MFQKKILNPTLEINHPIPKVQIVIAIMNSPSPLPFAFERVPNMHKQIKSGTVTHNTKNHPSFFKVSAFPRSSNLVSKA